MVILIFALVIGVSFSLELKLKDVFSLRFEKPVFMLESPVERGRFYILEQEGVVKTFKKGDKRAKVFLDLRDRVLNGGEMGILGMAFHPKFSENGYFFVYYTDRDMNSVVARYKAKSFKRADPHSENILLRVKQPFTNHNGGMLAFGSDGYLYIALGDGGSAGDPYNHAQNTRTLLGSILRIDVNTEKGYSVPSDNPFVKGGGRKEIYAWGFRNPWRFSFDRKTGKLWVGDVGQDRWEEINIVEGGKNYGWRCYEGNHPYRVKGCLSRDRYAFPVYEYPLKEGNCAVVGGYVYRGNRIKDLYGAYVFGDFCSGRIWAISEDNGKYKARLLLDTELKISSFAEDTEGNIYVIDIRGKIYLLTD